MNANQEPQIQSIERLKYLLSTAIKYCSRAATRQLAYVALTNVYFIHSTEKKNHYFLLLTWLLCGLELLYRPFFNFVI